jgi:hypothetical protein
MKSGGIFGNLFFSIDFFFIHKTFIAHCAKKRKEEKRNQFLMWRINFKFHNAGTLELELPSFLFSAAHD